MKQLRRVLPLVDPGAESPQETRTRLLLVAGGLPKPQTQIVVHNDWGAVLARIDMGWEEWLVGVEYGRNTKARNTAPTRASAPTTSNARPNWSVGAGA